MPKGKFLAHTCPKCGFETRNLEQHDKDWHSLNPTPNDR